MENAGIWLKRIRLANPSIVPFTRQSHHLFNKSPQSSPIDYLSSGFSKVDSSQDPDVFISCLQTLGSLPYFQSYKEESIKLLEISEGSRIIEVGCGLGQDAIAIARMVGKQGKVVAIDSSRKMMETASRSSIRTDSISYGLADACRLPFSDNAFDGARADRVLQHISDPRKAFSEMIRVVRVIGRLAIYEPDWGTFIISPGQKDISRTMTQLFGDTFPSGWIGRQPPGFFREEGLEGIQIDAKTFFTDDLQVASSPGF